LEELQIPRWVFRQDEDTSNLSFHLFMDASQDVYAAVLFARTEGAEEVYVQLIGARARAAPMEITIPRLELLAAIGNIGCGIRSKMLRI